MITTAQPYIFPVNLESVIDIVVDLNIWLHIFPLLPYLMAIYSCFQELQYSPPIPPSPVLIPAIPHSPKPIASMLI